MKNSGTIDPQQLVLRPVTPQHVDPATLLDGFIQHLPAPSAPNSHTSDTLYLVLARRDRHIVLPYEPSITFSRGGQLGVSLSDLDKGIAIYGANSHVFRKRSRYESRAIVAIDWPDLPLYRKYIGVTGGTLCDMTRQDVAEQVVDILISFFQDKATFPHGVPISYKKTKLVALTYYKPNWVPILAEEWC